MPFVIINISIKLSIYLNWINNWIDRDKLQRQICFMFVTDLKLHSSIILIHTFRQYVLIIFYEKLFRDVSLSTKETKLIYVV